MSRWRRSASNALAASSFGLLATLLGSSVGCEFITRVDRSQIPDGPGGAGGGGSGGGCTTAEDCPGTDTACRTRACTDGTCGFTNAPAGTATSNQTAADCLREVCDGQGEVTTEFDDSDIIVDQSDCTTDLCSGGQPQNVPLAAGALCTSNNGKVCDGAGACVECAVPSDCTSLVCVSNQCVAPGCIDMVKNGLETDVDCGGPDCTGCADGLACNVASDCESSVCALNVCQVPTCSDGVENGSESDVDCGGSCVQCGPGLGCNQNSDCIGGSCSGSVCLATCTDNIKNANETDVDCGGPTCNPCADGEICSVGSDCESKVCDGNGTCLVPTCTDNVQNGLETGVDCGGPTCAPCGVGLGCSTGTDCESGVCSGTPLICQAPTCLDLVKNGSETDVDCGGGVCPGCDLGEVCAQNGDCTSNICVNAICEISLCGDSLLTGAETCDDGNAMSGDGCDSTCASEAGFTCSGVPSMCTPICNDGMVVFGEPCDDGNATDGDGCSAACTVEPGFGCMGSPSMCATVCGDGLGAPSEQCDDGNVFGGDGCSQTCTIEMGFNCVAGNPSVCTEICGDSLLVGFEQCDDGNANNGDGCTDTCYIETGYNCAGVPSTCYPIELEPNNTCIESSGPYEPPFVLDGRITPIGDLDYIKVIVPAYADLRIETFSPTVGICTTVDPDVTLYAPDCTTQLVYDDLDGQGLCGLINPAVDAAARNIAPGTYFVKVNDYGNNGTIPGYKLEVTFVALCGNGIVEGSETCDDGNTMAGDGCAVNCRVEPVFETEPNDVCGQANGPYTLPALLGGAITPNADKDLYAFTIPAHADIRIQTYAPGYDTCTTGVDTVIQLRGTDCTTVLTSNDNGGVGTCSLINSTTHPAAANLPPGTYYVHVEENGDNALIASYQLLIGLNALCGDGVIQGTETCDDGGTTSGDGCADNCRLEQGWTCTGAPSVCTFDCGNGAITGSEQCDDMNTNAGDGCSPLCTFELDYNCTGTPSVCTPYESLCNDGMDNDGDTNIDATDTDCQIPGYFSACAVGETLRIFKSIDVPKAIPDSPALGITSNLFIGPGAGTIARASLLFDITHTYTSDVDIFLTPPSGTIMDVASDIGNSNDNFTNTILDSTCATSVTAGAPPFSGCFAPETSFNSLATTQASGTWAFKAVDDAGIDTGTIQSWAMIFCMTP